MALRFKRRARAKAYPAPPVVDTPSNFTADYIYDRVVADGGTADYDTLATEFNALPTFIKQTATMMSMVPTARKTGKYYSFDNRAVSGTIIASNFSRTTQAVGMGNAYYPKTFQINEPAFSYDNTYYADKQAIIDSINANPSKKLVVNYLPAGYVTNGTVDYSSALNSALSGGGDVIMPDFPIRVSGTSNANVRSNTRLLFQANSVMYVTPYTTNYYYRVLQCRGANNIIVIDAKVRGDKGNGGGGSKPLSYENGACIEFSDCDNAVFYDPHVYDGWGDGMFAGDVSNANISTNCKVYYGIGHNNGRNNVSVSSGQGIDFVECIYAAADKSNPCAGVDVEADDGLTPMTDIRFFGIRTFQNIWSGIQLSTSQKYNTTPPTTHQNNFHIEDHYSDDDCWAFRPGWNRDNTGGSTEPHLVGVVTVLNSSYNNAHAYVIPPGGEPGPFTVPAQDGDKVIIRQSMFDSTMTIKFLHPKINVNGVQYSDAQLTTFFNSSHMSVSPTVKVLDIP